MITRPAYSNTNQDRFFLELTREEKQMLEEAIEEYREYYINRKLGTVFGMNLKTLIRKIEALK